MTLQLDKAFITDTGNGPGVWADFAAIVCDWCEVRHPATGMLELTELGWDCADWIRLRDANRDMCGDCYQLLLAEVRE